MIDKNDESLLKKLFQNQRFAVIATQDKNEPYTNLVAFFSTNNFKNIIFATSKNTKKFNNILKNSRISVLIDNRDNTVSDVDNAVVVTAIGSAEEFKEDTQQIKNSFLEKHPYLADFIDKSDSTFISVKVDKYIVVNNFQNVKTFVP